MRRWTGIVIGAVIGAPVVFIVIAGVQGLWETAVEKREIREAAGGVLTEDLVERLQPCSMITDPWKREELAAWAGIEIQPGHALYDLPREGLPNYYRGLLVVETNSGRIVTAIVKGLGGGGRATGSGVEEGGVDP